MKKKGFLIVLSFVLIVTFAINGISKAEETTNKDLKLFNENTTSEASKTESSDTQDVKLSIMQKPKIDIVLSKARTLVDIQNFEKDLFRELENLNIDTENVEVSAVKTEQITSVENFTWQQDVSSSIGSISITNNGQNVKMTGNKSNAGKNAIWIMPTVNQEQKFHFSYNINFGDSFKAAGMLLRVKEVGNTLTGYAVSFNKSGQDYYTGSGSKNGALWKFTYVKGQNTTNMTKTLVSGINISTSGTVDISATDSKITISGGGLTTPYEYNIPGDDNTIGNGYGFFTDHYSHGCDNIGSFQLTGINLETSIIKKFTEVLREPDWRDESYKFLVDVDDYSNSEFNEKAQYSEILTRLLNENIHLVAWGTSVNETEFEKLIKDNNTNGLFLHNAEYNSAIEKTVEYIKEVVGTPEETQSVIVGEPLDIVITPSDIQNNTIDEDWPYGKWKVDHDYTYFENNMGQFFDSGKYLDSFINVFNKTGRYVITFRDQSIVPTEVFVHRRPVAQIGMQIEGTNVTLTSESYDLDEYSKENHGIAEEEWKWKDVDETEWHDGKLPAEIDSSKTYIVQLRVKDNQNSWSTPISKYINNEGLPVAMFDVLTQTITKYSRNVEIKDLSYDPAGKELTTYLWEVYKDGVSIYSSNTPKVDFTDVEEGEYTVYLTVTNASGKTSEKFAKKIEVIDDTIAPEVVASPIEADWAQSTTVHVKFTDEGESGFKSYQYAITDTQTAPETYGAEITNSEDDIVVAEDGLKYLHIIATDNAGNVSDDRVLGIYKIDRTSPNGTATITQPTSSVRNAIINFTATDNESGVAKIVKPDNTEVTNANTTYNVTNPGTYTFKVVDNVGNEKTIDVEVTVVSDGVVVKYVDVLDSNKEIDTSVTINGNVGQNYTTTPIEKEGFRLVSTPENANGIMTMDKIEVVYGYKKISEGVDVKYIDQVTKQEVATAEHFDGLQGDSYTSEEKEVSGYELVKTPSNVTGNMTVEKTVVTYEYRKQSNVIVKYIDEISNTEIEPQTSTTYKEGDTYTTLPKNKEGYVVTTEPENKEGTVERTDITVIYGYKKISEGLVVKYVDEIKNEILDTKSYTGNEGDKVTLEEKTIDGYVISQRPEVTEVTLTPTSQEVTYYYKKQVTTEVIGIDANSKEEIYKDVVDGIEGDSYTATAKNLQGYQLVGRPQTETVTMDRNVSKVIYTYKKVSHGVTIKYVDDYSGEILDQETITGLENDSYTSETKEYEKYDFVRIEGNANGNMTVNPIEVIYHYEKKTGIVEVIYVDEEGNELFVETMEDKVDNEYKVEEKEVKNYRVKEYPENLEGIYELEKQTVTYIMEKIPGKVIVNLKDEEGNIMKVLEGNGYVGEEYEIELPEIKGYFIDGEKILKVAYEDGEVVVDVIYNKVPETGDINVVINLAILILSVAVVTKKLFNFACNIK